MAKKAGKKLEKAIMPEADNEGPAEGLAESLDLIEAKKIAKKSGKAIMPDMDLMMKWLLQKELAEGPAELYRHGRKIASWDLIES